MPPGQAISRESAAKSDILAYLLSCQTGFGRQDGNSRIRRNSERRFGSMQLNRSEEIIWNLQSSFDEGQV